MAAMSFEKFARKMYTNLPELRSEYGKYLNLEDRKNLQLVNREFRRLTQVDIYEGPKESIDLFLQRHVVYKDDRYNDRRDLYSGRVYRFVPESRRGQLSRAQFIEARLEPLPHTKILVDQLRRLPSDVTRFLDGDDSAYKTSSHFLNQIGARVIRSYAELGETFSRNHRGGHGDNVFILSESIFPFVAKQIGHSSEFVRSSAEDYVNYFEVILGNPSVHLLFPVLDRLTTDKDLTMCLSQSHSLDQASPALSAKWLGSRYGMIFGVTIKSYLLHFRALHFADDSIKGAALRMSEKLRWLLASPAPGLIPNHFLFFCKPLEKQIHQVVKSDPTQRKENYELFHNELMRIYDRITLPKEDASQAEG